MIESRNWKVPFFTIWGGQAISLLGSNLVQFALIWWLTETTGSAAVLATATTVALLPTIFLGPFAGALVDRLSRRWVLILADGSIALFTALLAVLFWLGIAQPWHVLAILFLRALGDAFHNPAMFSTVPLMVPRTYLSRVSGMNSLLDGALYFVGPPIGALLLDLIDVRGVLPIDVVTALLAILPLLVIRVPQPLPRAISRGMRGVLNDMGEGLRFCWNYRGVRLFMLTSMMNGMTNRPLVSYLPLLVTGHFGGGALELSWLYSAMGIGLVASGLIMSATGGLRRHLDNAVLGAAGNAVAALIISLAPANALWLAVVAFALFGLANAFNSGGQTAMRQTVVPPEMLGRVSAVWSSVFGVIGPISLAITAPLVDAWGTWFLWPVATGVAAVTTSMRRFIREIYFIEELPRPAGIAPAAPEGAEVQPATQA